MAMCEQSSLTSDRTCELNMIVLPSPCSRWMMRFTSSLPTGSRPVIGSSSSTSSGSLISAWAMPMRCSMPLEYLRRWTSAASVSPTSARRRATRSLRVPASMREDAVAEDEELAPREVVVEVRVLGQIAHCAESGDTQLDRARRRAHEAQGDLHGGGLAGAVGPQQAHHFVRADAEVDAAKDVDTRPQEAGVDRLADGVEAEHGRKDGTGQTLVHAVILTQSDGPCIACVSNGARGLTGRPVTTLSPAPKAFSV